ncbi:MAG: glutaminyl-peptide cyclotransferase [bacterium]
MPKLNNNRIFLSIAMVLIFLFSCSACRKATDKEEEISEQTTVQKLEPRIVKPVIVRVFPHDNRAYTQGLFYRDGYLYESTGQRGQSSLRKVNINDGGVIKSVSLPDMYFGEGIAYFENKIYMLTWITNKGFIYDFKTFAKLGEFEYNNEGWGLASDSSRFYFTDGSNKIMYMDHKGFVEQGTSICTYKGKVIDKLNELEIVGDTLYANVYTYDIIARINKNTGEVFDIIDCSALRAQLDNQNTAEVLNGIAYNTDTKTYYLTGKYWDKYFEVIFK